MQAQVDVALFELHAHRVETVGAVAQQLVILVKGDVDKPNGILDRPCKCVFGRQPVADIDANPVLTDSHMRNLAMLVAGA